MAHKDADVQLVGTCLNPAESRARLIKGMYIALGHPDVPVAAGTSYKQVPDYQFDVPYMADPNEIACGTTEECIIEMITNLVNEEWETYSPENKYTILVLAGRKDPNLNLETK